MFKVKKTEKADKYAQTDSLTGLPNRRYFKEMYGEKGMFNTMRYKAVAVYNLDDFMAASEEQDGDELLLAVTKVAKRVLGDNCVIFRWSLDEFTVLMEWSIEFATELCKEFCREVEKECHVTASVGITEVRLTEPIKKHYHRAMQGCYLVKEMGGNGVKRL